MEETQPDAENSAGKLQSNLTMMDVLDLPDGERQIVQLLLRRGGMSVAALAEELRQAEAETRELVAQLAVKGFLGQGEQPETWRALLASKRVQRSARGILAALDE
jgi:predicted transcriptional regulator